MTPKADDKSISSNLRRRLIISERLLSVIVASVLGMLVLLPGTVLASATGSLEGFIRDKETGERLVGANVLIVGTRLGGAADANGFYHVLNIPAGVYDVRFTFLGYQTLMVRDVRISPGLKTMLNEELNRTHIELEAVEVSAERPPIQKDVTGTMHTATRETFTVLPVTTVGEVIGLQPGVTLDNNIRGGKTTEVVYLIDGIPVQNLIEGGSGSDLPQSSISELAVHTGGFDPEYGNALSGVVNIITRRGGDSHVLTTRAEKDDLFGGKQVDHRNELDLSASGPVVSDMYYFTSAQLVQTGTRWWQDLSRFYSRPHARTYNAFGKLDYNVSSTMRLSGHLLYSYNKWSDYEFSWRFNLSGLPERSQEGYRMAILLSHSPSASFFYNLSLSRYALYSEVAEGSRDQVDTTLYEWDFFLQYVVGGSRALWARREQISNLLKTDFTWRLNEHHLFRFGGELNLQEIYSDVVRYEPRLNIFGKPFVNKPLLNQTTDFRYFPRSGAAYVQDKIELTKDGMLLNLGLRYEFLDPRAERPLAERVPVQEDEFETRVVSTVPASVKHLLSPRIGFAAPFATHGYLFVNYGHYYQFPLFDHLYSGLNNVSLRKGVGVLVGNPDLRPERTRAWEMSIKYALENNVVLSATYFHKETINQVDIKTFVPTNARIAGDYGFAEFVNNPFAKATGLELMVTKDLGPPLTGSISYTLMNAEGLSEDARSGLSFFQWGIPVPPRPFPLSWDQRHTVKLIGTLRMPWDVVVSASWVYHSGRPYTFYPSRDGFTPEDPSLEFEPNNVRMGPFNLLNLKASKVFSIGLAQLPAMRITVYVDGRNILNARNVRWVDSSGRVGGELGDLSAWEPPRRVRVGMRVDL